MSLMHPVDFSLYLWWTENDLLCLVLFCFVSGVHLNGKQVTRYVEHNSQLLLVVESKVLGRVFCLGS